LEYKIKIPVFEGPFDLLLHLVKENQVSIYDIPIALITEQYLDYLELLKKNDLGISGEFIVVAASLLYIKSKMLLPRHEGMEEEEDPRKELIQQLLEYQKFKEVSKSLEEREQKYMDYFYRSDNADGIREDEDVDLLDLDYYDLLKSLIKYVPIIKERSETIKMDTFTVGQKIKSLMEDLSLRETMTFTEIISKAGSRIEVIISFLSVLEMVKLGIISLSQESLYGEISVTLKNVEREEEWNLAMVG